MSAVSIQAVDPSSLLGNLTQTSAPASGSVSFSKMLMDGLENVNEKQGAADKMVQAFALDDSIPVHQVTYALEQAQLSLQLMLQVRGHLVEGYQQLMNMQL
jgi:flagellar hook-basal body complex protein FliE